MKIRLLFVALGCMTFPFAFANDFAGSDWTFNYSGNYSIANVNTSNEGIIASVLGSTLNLTAQLNLINGTTSATNVPVSITQSALNNIQVNNLNTTAVAGPGLVSGLGAFVANTLNLSNGTYNGVISGSNVALSKTSAATVSLNGLIDTRVLGTGVVLNLEAIVPNSTMNGTVTGVDSGGSTPFGGGRANTITGTSANMATIGLEADVVTYVAGIATLNTGYIPVAAIQNQSTSWNLQRNAHAGGPVPTPGAGLTLLSGLGAFFFKKRRATV